MSTLGNYLAIGILIVVTFVFLRNRYFITKATRWFGVCLVFTYVTAITNSLRSYVILNTPESTALTKFAITFDILFSLLTTSVIALYLISKVTEHALKERSDFLRGKIVIGSLMMMTGYLTGMAVFGAMIRDYTPQGKAGAFQGLRIIGQVLIPGIIGPSIGALVLKNAKVIVGNDGTQSFVPNQNIFIAALVVGVFAIVISFIVSKAVKGKKEEQK